MGVVPSSYPVDLIHLFTSGPQEAIIQVALKPDAPRGEALREKLRGRPAAGAAGLPGFLRSRRHRHPGDELRIAHADRSRGAGRQPAGRLRLRAEDPARSWRSSPSCAICNSPRRCNYPTLDINIDRERAGQFGLTMADVVRSVVPATSSSRFTEPNYWRDPNSGNAFQIQVELPQNRMQSVDEVGSLPVMHERPLASRSSTDIADAEAGHHARPDRALQRPAHRQPDGEYSRHHAGRGGAEAEPGAGRARARRREGVTVVMRGEIPPLEQTISGLRIGLLLAVLVIFLLLSANFQSMRLALAIVLTIPAVLCGVLLMLLVTGTTLNIQSFMGAIMAIGIAVANSILLVTFAERSRHEGQARARGRSRRRRQPAARDPDDGRGDDLRHGADGDRIRRGRIAIGAAGPRRDRRPDRLHLRHADHPAFDLRHSAREGIH